MIVWGIILIVSIIAVIIIGKKCCFYDVLPTIGFSTLIVICIIVFIAMIAVPINTNQFMYVFMKQKEMIETNYTSISDGNSLACIVDINNKLFEYQSSKQVFGIFSMIPNKIMDLEPIIIK